MVHYKLDRKKKILIWLINYLTENGQGVGRWNIIMIMMMTDFVYIITISIPNPICEMHITIPINSSNNMFILKFFDKVNIIVFYFRINYSSCNSMILITNETKNCWDHYSCHRPGLQHILYMYINEEFCSDLILHIYFLYKLYLWTWFNERVPLLESLVKLFSLTISLYSNYKL